MGEISETLNFHVTPDHYITEPVIIGRDILERNASVKIDGDKLTFSFMNEVTFINRILLVHILLKLNTDWVGDNKEALTPIVE